MMRFPKPKREEMGKKIFISGAHKRSKKKSRQRRNKLLHGMHYNQVLLENCELIYSGAVLNCSDLSTIPNGSSYQGIDALNFHNNNFTELTPYIFKNHSFHDLQIIIIRQNNISQIHPYAFADMWSVKELDLYGNNLTYLHENVFIGLKRLQYLDLGHNKLVLIEGASFKPLQNLETLDLSYNDIKVVSPYLLKHTMVSELYLSGNEFEFAQDNPILESTSLSVLTLQSCKLKTLNKNLFKTLPNLIHLDMSYNQIQLIPEDLLKPLKHLEHLDISNNQISNLHVNMFPLPSKMQVLFCDKNLLERHLDCDTIIEQLQTKETKTIKTTTAYLANTQSNQISTEPSQENNSLIPKQRVVEFGLINITSLFDTKNTTRKLLNGITEAIPKVDGSPTGKRKELEELDPYVYAIYGLSGYVATLIIIFFIEVVYIIKIETHKSPRQSKVKNKGDP
ncbi:hypothetical protein ILUMI_13911 [Ignelater luminosus]|uniref:Uncharacterized protein n=1 Tax=Ignelater luminosus TaxID=2038154 RepID=A0A8K0GAG7_IGNLU|nr:hypothetical protein ILUMI_13911 [Ignelater luminosus]